MKLLLTLMVFCLFNIEQILASLKDADIRDLAAMDDQEHFEIALKNLLVPRVVGSKGWKNVQNFLIDEMRSMDMEIEVDTFTDNTPFGRLEFANIIGTLNPTADKFLVLSAHYDSKHFPNQEFIGATDSSVPCAIMLNLVNTTLPILKRLLQGKNLGLMLVFFDGEEAFVEWSDEDSTYGSRHLAQKWATTRHKNGKQLDRINVLVLLDLIGASNARFICTFPETCSLNRRLNEIENTLKSTNSLKTVFNGPANIFTKAYRPTKVSDDHLPFMKRNVPILHLIPQSFPSQWHKLDDNGENLDQDAILNFNRIMRVFIVDYLMDCSSPNPPPKCSSK